jgi:hypothetical protein
MPMPRYYFHLRSKDRFTWDEEGVDLPDPITAQGASDKVAAELHGGLLHESGSGCCWIVAAKDEGNQLIHITALAIAGFVTTMLSQDHEAGVSAIERALTLNPSCATALYLGAITHAFAGHPAAATAQATRALRLRGHSICWST